MNNYLKKKNYINPSHSCETKNKILNHYKSLKKENLYLFSSVIFGLFSILLARKFNIHYLLTIAPFFIILSSSIFSITFL
mgnify:CR=1 FL=1